jgi:AcrR family transcriptional regulator
MYTVNVNKPSRGPMDRFFYRNRLLEAAARVFGERGIREATIDDILAAAGISRRTLYQYFRSKDELLVALFTVWCDLLLHALRDAIRRETGVARVERCVDMYLGFRKRAGPIMRELEAESLRPGSPLEPVRRELLDAASRELAQHIVDANGRAADPLVVVGVLAALEGIAHRMDAPGYAEARARAAMMRLAIAALALPGEPVPALPVA